jgi:hypothetical protein
MSRIGLGAAVPIASGEQPVPRESCRSCAPAVDDRGDIELLVEVRIEDTHWVANALGIIQCLSSLIGNLRAVGL